MSDFYFEFQDRTFADVPVDPALKFQIDRAEFAALGGPDLATVNVTGPARAIWDLVEWLRYAVTIRTVRSDRFWWGFINSVEVNANGRSLRMSLDNMFNRVKISYSYVPTGSTTVVDRRETEWSGDADSIADYGYKEIITQMDSATPAAAVARQAALLAQKKYPQGVFGLSFSRDDDREVTATLHLLGWWHTLDWRYASTLSINGIDNAVWGDANSIQIGHSSFEKTCMQFTTGADSGAVREITICAAKVGAPVDALQVEIYALDGSGHPTGTALGSETIAASNLNSCTETDGPDWDDIITFQLSTNINLSASTQYGLVISRTGSLDDTNHYRLQLDTSLSYTGGSAFVYTTAGGWQTMNSAYGQPADIPFILWMDIYMGAGRLMDGLISEYGEFITDIKFWDESTVETSSYLAGSRSLLDELIPIMESAGENNRRMLAWVDWNRMLQFSEEPEDGTITYYMDHTGQIYDGDRQPVGLGDLYRIAGTYVQILDLIPDSVDLTRLININVHFVEGLKWSQRLGIQPVFRGQKQIKDIVGTAKRDTIPSGLSPTYQPGQYTNEDARVAVGMILLDTSSVEFTFDSSTPKIEASVKPSGVDHDSLMNFVAGEHVDHAGVSISAGDGLTGGGDISASRTLSLTTPATLSVSSANNASGNHSHAITSSTNPGAAASLLATDASGFLQLTRVGLGISPSYPLDVSGDARITGELILAGSVTGHLIPNATDTYDLGSSTKLWRKGYLSELDAVLFAQQTVTLVGGWLFITKQEGTFSADVASADTTIDFGTSMTVGDFVLCRAAGAVEYIEVGSLVSGTTYNVTRDKDGSGANDWPTGTPFAVLGATGDGRIELNAYDTPRIQIIEQGSTYNGQTEKARFGDLNGNWGYSSAIYGLALGEYASNKPNITIDGTNGLRIRSYTTDVMTFDTSGNAKITGKLQMPESASAIAIGSTPPTASNAGTGIWLDRTGIYALDAGDYQVKIDATDGKLYAGAGNVILDEDGILIGETSYANREGMIEFFESSGPTVFSVIGGDWGFTGGQAAGFWDVYNTIGQSVLDLSASGPTSMVSLSARDYPTRLVGPFLELRHLGGSPGDNDIRIYADNFSVDYTGNVVVGEDITYRSAVLGEWNDWTPTIGYGGGTTDPTSATVNSARYSRVGNVIKIYADISITRGTGDRVSTTLSYPVTPSSFDSVGVADQRLTAVGHNIAIVYMAANIVVYHGAMTRSGTINLYLEYEV